MTGNEGQQEATVSPTASGEQRRWLTTADVAAQTGFSYIGVSRAAAREDLVGHKVGGSWRFTQAEVDAWIEGSTKRRNRARAVAP